MMKYSIIIFCFNEEKNIKKVIIDAIFFLNQPQFDQSEIIVINDGSTDHTRSIIDELHSLYPQLIINHIYPNKGIGNALNSGYDLATKDYICAIPGDGQFNIHELGQIQPFEDHTFISFYRKEKKYNFYRNSLTQFNQLFNRWVLGIHVPDINWIKIYKKSHLIREHRTLNSSLVESEICAKLIKTGIQHIDYPSEYLDRKFGEAKGGNWNTLKKAIAELISLYITILKFSKNA